MRLHKYMADCGVASRRKSEELIAQGRVSVNGETVKTMGYDVNDKDRVEVDGELIRPHAGFIYIALNKPEGVVTTMQDPQGRPTVADIVKVNGARVFPVGRLDADTEGLLLLTNDGDMAHFLMHPKHEVDKTYIALVSGRIEAPKLEQLSAGVIIDGSMTRPAQIKVYDQTGPLTMVRLTIHEGKNRQIRRMFVAVGCRVVKLKRESVGHIKLGELKVGHWRYLTDTEVSYLKKLNTDKPYTKN